MEQVFFHMDAGLSDPAVVIDEAESEAAAVAQEVAVDLPVVAIVRALESTVTLTRKRIAAHGTSGTDRRCRLEIPLAGVRGAERLVSKDAGGADFHQVAGKRAFEHAVLGAPEIHART